MCYISFQKKWLFPTRKHFFQRDQKEESQQHLYRCTWFKNMLAKFHLTHGSLYTHGLLDLLWSLVQIWKMLMNRSTISQLMFLLDTWTGQITLKTPILWKSKRGDRIYISQFHPMVKSPLLNKRPVKEVPIVCDKDVRLHFLHMWEPSD